jgi:class 3 adenylate cyclase
MAHDAIIDKFVGDGVMALFLSDLPTLGARTCDEMVAAAQEMLAAATTRPGALGDVVNVESRLQGCAGPGQVVISEEAFSRLHDPIDATSGPSAMSRARFSTQATSTVRASFRQHVAVGA